jgi:hypothetical protein
MGKRFNALKKIPGMGLWIASKNILHGRESE